MRVKGKRGSVKWGERKSEDIGQRKWNKQLKSRISGEGGGENTDATEGLDKKTASLLNNNYIWTR
jgi:hypothetical protein